MFSKIPISFSHSLPLQILEAGSQETSTEHLASLLLILNLSLTSMCSLLIMRSLSLTSQIPKKANSLQISFRRYLLSNPGQLNLNLHHYQLHFQSHRLYKSLKRPLSIINCKTQITRHSPEKKDTVLATTKENPQSQVKTLSSPIDGVKGPQQVWELLLSLIENLLAHQDLIEWLLSNSNPKV